MSYKVTGPTLSRNKLLSTFQVLDKDKLKKGFSKNGCSEEEIARKTIIIINTDSFFIYYSKFPTFSTFTSQAILFKLSQFKICNKASYFSYYILGIIW